MSYAPEIKNWWQAIATGGANYITTVLEGMLAGAAVGLLESGLFFGGKALMSGGVRGLSQASINYLKTMPANIGSNLVGMVGLDVSGGTVALLETKALAFVGALHGTTSIQAVLSEYGSTGSVGGWTPVRGLIAMEEGLYHSSNKIYDDIADNKDKEGKDIHVSWQDSRAGTCRFGR